MSAKEKILIVVGAGPAGLRAAEVATTLGARVIICDWQRSAGRKFLVAGRGGLNLTHGEPVENFPGRYRAETERWQDLLDEFGPDDLRAWAAELEVETYVGTSGRVFPRGQKAAGLLRAWIRRLRAGGVEFRTSERLSGLTREGPGWRLDFANEDWRAEHREPQTLPFGVAMSRENALGVAELRPPLEKAIPPQGGTPAVGRRSLGLFADAVVLALGGASWPETGSDGNWSPLLARHGVEMAPLVAANCGWNVAWPAEVLERAEGLPLKNLAVRAAHEVVSGELLITRHGLEGGAIYRLGPVLRAMKQPALRIDFKPEVTAEVLRERSAQLALPNDWFRVWKLSRGAIALLQSYYPQECANLERVIDRIKNFILPLQGPRPICEAISTAGGVLWRELDDSLMLQKMPGVFLAGEMIDWEAPTGGYLLQGCFSTGTRAGRGAAEYLSGRSSPS